MADVITKTYKATLTAVSTTAITPLVAINPSEFASDERLAVYLESFFLNLYIPSFAIAVFPELDGDEPDGEVLSAISSAERKSQKVGLRILTKKTTETVWTEIAEAVVVNRGRKDYFDLLVPYLSKVAVRLLERDDQVAVQLIDYGNGLLKLTDFITVNATIRIEAKKNDDLESLKAQLEALELALYGRLTNLPAGSLLGRDSTTGVAEVIPLPLSTSKGGLGVVNSGLYGSVAISAATKGGWAGCHFQGAYAHNYLMHNPANGDIGLYSATPGAPFWRWLSTADTLTAGQPFAIGIGGTAVKRVLMKREVVDLPSIAAGGLYTFTMSLAGAVGGSHCNVVPTINPLSNGFWTMQLFGVVETAEIVTIYVRNNYSAALDIGPFWVSVQCIEY
jgi:hypothetical protein